MLQRGRESASTCHTWGGRRSRCRRPPMRAVARRMRADRMSKTSRSMVDAAGQIRTNQGLWSREPAVHPQHRSGGWWCRRRRCATAVRASWRALACTRRAPCPRCATAPRSEAPRAPLLTVRVGSSGVAGGGDLQPTAQLPAAVWRLGEVPRQTTGRHERALRRTPRAARPAPGDGPPPGSQACHGWDQPLIRRSIVGKPACVLPRRDTDNASDQGQVVRSMLNVDAQND